MNILEVQDKLKNLSEQQLAQEMQMPSGMAPQFLVLSELQRRKRVRDDYAGAQASAPTTTVAQEAVTAAGMPQQVAGQMAQTLAPQTDVTQNTGIASLPVEPQRMAGGGMVRKMQVGGAVYTDPAVKAMANRLGMSVDEYLKSLGPNAALVQQQAEQRAARNRMTQTEPPMSMATPPDLFQSVNPSYAEQTTSTFPDDSVPASNGLATPPQALYNPMPEQPSTNVRPDWETMRPDPRRGALDLLRAPSFEATGRRDMQSDYQTQDDQIAYLKSVIADETRPVEERVRAARDLEALNNQIQTTQFSGVDPATGVSIPPGYMMTALGLQPDPNYKAPGKTGVGMVDQAANKGTAGLEELKGIVPDEVLATAEPAAKLSDYEQKINPLNLNMALLNEQRDNRYLPESMMAELDKRLAELGQEKAALTPPAFDGGAAKTLAVEGLLPNEPPAKPPVDAAAVGPTELQNPAVRQALAAANAEEAKQTTEEAAAAAAEPAVEQTTTGGSGGLGGIAAGEAGPMSDYEKALADALKRTEKRAEQDKWLALAQMGMALMSSKQPTLGGALGEAGLAGLGQYQQTRDAAEKDRLGIMGTQYEMDMAKQKLALDRAALAAKSSGSGYNSKLVDDLAAQSKTLAEQLEGLVGPTGQPIPVRKDEYELIAAMKADVDKRWFALTGGGMNTSVPTQPVVKVPQQ